MTHLTGRLALVMLAAVMLAPGCGRRVDSFVFVGVEELVDTPHTKHWVYVGQSDRFVYLKRVDYEFKEAGELAWQSVLYRFYDERGFAIARSEITIPAKAAPGSRMRLGADGRFDLADSLPMRPLEIDPSRLLLQVPPAQAIDE